MTNFREMLKLEIQKRREEIKKRQNEIKILSGMFSGNAPDGSLNLSVVAGQRPAVSRHKSKNTLLRITREEALEAFKKVPVIYTSPELCKELRDLLNRFVTVKAAYAWSRNFREEGLVTPAYQTERFNLRPWIKTEKGKALSHDIDKPPTV